MIIGIACALLAGSFLSMQNIFNSKVNERTGTWAATTLILALGFLASFIIGWIVEGNELFVFQNSKLWFWFSGLLGVGVVSCMVQGLRLLGPTFAISLALTSQLCFALLADTMGWFGLAQVPLSPQKLIGVLIIICGILLYKLGGYRKIAKIKNVV